MAELRITVKTDSRAYFGRYDLLNFSVGLNSASDKSKRKGLLNREATIRFRNEAILLRLIGIRFSFFLSEATFNKSNKYVSDAYCIIYKQQNFKLDHPIHCSESKYFSSISYIGFFDCFQHIAMTC